MDKISSKSAVSESSEDNKLEVNFYEAHGFVGYEYHWSARHADIQHGTDDKVINLYACLPEHKDFTVVVGGSKQNTIYVDTGIYIELPRGNGWKDLYYLYVYQTGEERLKMAQPYQTFYHCLPNEIQIEFEPHTKNTIKEGEFLAHACLIPLDIKPEDVDKENILKIAKRVKLNVGCGLSGGSGWSRPYTNNSVSQILKERNEFNELEELKEQVRTLEQKNKELSTQYEQMKARLLECRRLEVAKLKRENARLQQDRLSKK